MTSRRSFLQMLGIAPVAAPAIAEELAKPKFLRGVAIRGFASGGFVGGERLGRFGDGANEQMIPKRLFAEVDRAFSRHFNSNTPRIRASHKYLPGLPERVSREKRRVA